MKRAILLLILIIILSIFLSSCSFGSIDTDNLMRPPKPMGENLEIQKALEAKLGTNITLKYPKTGAYRTAYVRCNIDDDIDEEVIVFYKMNAEVSGIRFNVLKKIDGTWESSADCQGEGTDVDKIIIADLSGDGINEIIVGWNSVSSKDKSISVYNFHGESSYDSRISKRFSEFYTVMEIVDFLGDNTQQIFTAMLNNALSTSTASLIAVTNDGYKVIGKTSLDGNVTSFTSISKGIVSDTTEGIYLDGYKGTNELITELVYFNGTDLIAPFYDEIEKATSITYRESSTTSRDIDGDGIIEIPLPVVMPGYENRRQSEQVKMTNWYTYNGKSIDIKMSTVNNLSDGYYFILPPAWVSTVTVDVSKQNRTMVFYEWIQKTDARNSANNIELLKIKVFPENELSNTENAGYVKLSTKNGLTYAYLLTNDKSTFGITKEIVKNNFIVL